MQDEWREVVGFPKYEVNQHGIFINSRTERPIKVSTNQSGQAKISLYQDRQLVTRSAAMLVAETFIEPPNDRFNSIIHLDGRLTYCAVRNLMWRPRWFVVKFHRQFKFPEFRENYLTRQPIVELDSGKEYENVYDVCTTEGLYHFDVHRSCVEQTEVPLTFQSFRYL